MPSLHIFTGAMGHETTRSVQSDEKRKEKSDE